MLLELAQRFLGLAFQADERKDRDRETELGRIEIGVIATDHPRFFQCAHTAQAGWRGQSHALGQFHVGDAALFLKLGQQPSVNSVQCCHVRVR
jgi:hypothetical protein